jgi:hypothetical protein
MLTVVPPVGKSSYIRTLSLKLNADSAATTRRGDEEA